MAKIKSKDTAPVTEVALTKAEKRVLVNIHFRGVMGKCGSMKQSGRVSLLNSLIAKEVLRNTGTRLVVTPKGKELMLTPNV